ncbi:S8 family serine peptidase [Neobacillus sp. CF12]|uniref:S8 family serine peptidase n=1 Tax=Neobacillus sp. CF12 TaxID=3055864 RepID=UPI0025A00A50|nr:S8 family serine peptidase [Neobacillus sp. CF12]MDM5327429.1 S8 family serine peptidase [Neobacillus sp. CF12]
MKKRRRLPFKVFTTSALATMLLSSTGFAEGIGTNPVPAPSVEEIVKQGQKIFLDEQRQAAEAAADQFGYKDLKKNGLAKPYQPNEKVRLIVEVEQPDTVGDSKQNKKAKYKQKQDHVIAQISKTKSAGKVKNRFYEAFNGFSIETEFSNLKEIQATPGVTNVHIARTFQPSMGASKELVQAQKVWEEYGYEGEGLLVAIVDSGIDFSHQDMKLTEQGKEKQKWTQEGIEGKFAETEVSEVWYNDKVPTGYDWADKDTDVIPRGQNGSSHGMHVAGTVGANGDEENDGVQGIAPGVQLLAEKVFSDNGGGAYEDDIIAGIEHAVTMGADVINMSLGSDAGYVGEENDPIQKSIREATEQGTLVVVAGGNSAYSTKNNLLQSAAKPYSENPDIGTVGEPSVSPYALSVASYENTNIHMNTLAEENGLQLPYQDQTQYNFKLSRVLEVGKSYELAYVGEGKTADFVGKDVTGKIVVAKPNQPYATYTYVQNEAKKKGAKAVILVPPSEVADYPYVYLSSFFIPAATTSKEAGDALIAKLTSGQSVKMKMSKGIYIENPDKNAISDFSSYGAPHTLDFKPEISAPGGNIYSTVTGNEYEIMSGTSMATPHVAGGSALLLQALYEKGLAHSKETALKAKIALMNTAQLIQDPRTNSEVPYSPRVQGSGLMQIQNAIKTPVLVTSDKTPLEQAGAVALKEITGNNAHFKLNVEALQNLDVKDLEYSVYVDVLTDDTETKKYDLDNDGTLDSKEYLTLTSKRVQGASVLVNGEKVTHTEGKTLKIKPGQEKYLDIQISLPASLKEGTFVEGYVRLVPTGKNSESAVPITVPYMGFYGKWDQAQNLDPAAWDKDAFLGYTVLWNDEPFSEGTFPLGYDPRKGTFNTDRIVISPNTIYPGVFPTFTTLRNLEKTEMYVENQNGQLVQYLGDFSEYTGKPWKFRKNVMAYRDYMNGGYLWDVKDKNGQVVKDGSYNYVIKTTLDYKNAKPQEVKLPVKVDSVAPVVSDIQVQPKEGQYEITFKAVDNENGSGFYGAIIWYNGKYMPLAQGQTSVLVKEEPKSVVVLGSDVALNHGYTVWGDPSYINDEMLVSWFSVYPNKNVNESTPAGINAFANNRVNWTINIKDGSGMVVDSIVVENEHEIHLEWKPEADLPNGTYTVSAEVENKQGFKVTTSPQSVTVLQQP